MTKIQFSRNNNSMVLVLDRKHYRLTSEEHDLDYISSLAMECIQNPTEEGIQELKDAVSVTFIDYDENLVADTRGNIYFMHSKVPLPRMLVEKIKTYKEKGWPITPLINFWNLCLQNPNEDARNRFFEFCETYGVTITTYGYALLYKTMHQEERDNDITRLEKFVSTEFFKRKKWKKNPANYDIYQDKETGEFSISESGQVNLHKVGNLAELYDQSILENGAEKRIVFTPWYKGGQYGNEVVLGKPVKQPRETCDPNISSECSYGLHVGSYKYVSAFGSAYMSVLACLVNPANVVALPAYDNSKIRVCEYFPYAIIEQDENGNWEEVEDEFFESDYLDYEIEELENYSAEEFANLSDEQKTAMYSRMEVLEL